MTKTALRDFRAKFRLTQQQTARLLAVHQSAYSMYESGERTIPPYIARSIEFFLALSRIEQAKHIVSLSTENA